MSDRDLLVVVPCLNEATHLDALLNGLRRDPGVTHGLIVVADGGSSDGSQQIVQRHAAADPRVRLFNNTKRIQSGGVNGAVQAFGEGHRYFVRVDAHSAYPEDYCEALHDAALESVADSVVVSMRAVANRNTCFQIAVATAQNSPLGTGGSAHRAAGERKWIDHGHHALFRTEAFVKAGGYDEAFSHNEDAELDARITAAGGRILLAGDIQIDYFPRAEPQRLARQYFMFGRGRAQNVKRHAMRMKIRQVAPLAVAPAVALALGGIVWAPLAAPAAAWLSACLVSGAVIGSRAGGGCAMLSGAPAAIMHVSWSLGFLVGALRTAPAARLGLRPAAAKVC